MTVGADGAELTLPRRGSTPDVDMAALPSSQVTGLFWSREADGPPGTWFSLLLLSREEPRAHVHVQNADGEAKFWIEPAVELFANYGLKSQQVPEWLRN